MGLGTRLEAIAFRFTILTALILAAFAGCFAWISRSDQQDARARAAAADSGIAAFHSRCDGHITQTIGYRPDPLGLFSDSTCEQAVVVNLVERRTWALESVKSERDEILWGTAFMAIFPVLAFGTFYVTRWLFTGRVTPLLPLHEREPRGVAVPAQGSSRRAP